MIRLIPFLVLACTPDAEPQPPDEPQAVVEGLYADHAMWLCHPDDPASLCVDPLVATDLLPDGSTATVQLDPAEDPGVDCFYVYPTVNLSADGLDTDFSEPDIRLDPIRWHAAPLATDCAVYAPYYRQVTLAAWDRTTLDEDAYADVLEAFQAFQAFRDTSRPFAVMGHSQGAFHLIRLLQEVVEPDETLLDQLAVAAIIGMGVYTPQGETVGGTFDHIPLCTELGQTGCVLSFASYASERRPGSDGAFGFDTVLGEAACTNPRDLLGHDGTSTAWFGNEANVDMFDHGRYTEHDTFYIRVAEMFRAECKREGVYHYLEISPAMEEGDQRELGPYRNSLAELIGFGTHIHDVNLVFEDFYEVMGAAMDAAE